ncbi:MAG: FGGY-family carbohydrate kinase, partial [Actinomycetota bacterium]
LGVSINRVLLIGGAAKNPAIATIASALFGREVLLPQPGEYVADGAARQAAWALSGSENPPLWNLGSVTSAQSAYTPDVVARYRDLRDKTANW